MPWSALTASWWTFNLDGTFAATVTLKPAPNLIEIVASDFQGNQVSAVLTIIYIPE